MEKVLNLLKIPQLRTRNRTPRKIISWFSAVAEEESPEVKSRRAILSEIDATLKDLRAARNCFENASDPEIVEACVYEIKSAEARYSFLLRKAKEAGINRMAF